MRASVEWNEQSLRVRACFMALIVFLFGVSNWLVIRHPE